MAVAPEGTGGGCEAVLSDFATMSQPVFESLGSGVRHGQGGPESDTGFASTMLVPPWDVVAHKTAGRQELQTAPLWDNLGFWEGPGTCKGWGSKLARMGKWGDGKGLTGIR